MSVSSAGCVKNGEWPVVELDDARAGCACLPQLPLGLDRRVLRRHHHDVVLAESVGDGLERRLVTELRERCVCLRPGAVRKHVRRARVGIGPVAAIELVAQRPGEVRVEGPRAVRPGGQQTGEVDADAGVDERHDLRAERVADDDRLGVRADERRTVLHASARARRTAGAASRPGARAVRDRPRPDASTRRRARTRGRARTSPSRRVSRSGTVRTIDGCSATS